MAKNRMYVMMKKMAVASGSLWSLLILVAGLASTATHGSYALQFVNVFASIYPGYGNTVLKSIIGGIWAFFDAAGAGVVFAYIYSKVK